MNRPRILVIGGIHGNEQLGIQLLKLLDLRPIENVDTLLANPRAVKAGKRFTESDLNRSFGKDFEGSYETLQASLIKRQVTQYDFVLDFHNTQTSANNCTFVGPDCESKLYDVITQLGFDKCIEATYDCINKYCNNVISIEISIGDKLDDASYWYELINKLTSSEKAAARKLDIYRFKRRVSWQEQQEYGIKGWEPFVPIDTSMRDKLKVNGIIVPIFIGSKLTEYYATLLSKERTI